MKIKDFIAELQKFDQDMEIVVDFTSCCYDDEPTAPRLELARMFKNGKQLWRSYMKIDDTYEVIQIL